jgi:putative DNA primase/helicase
VQWDAAVNALLRSNERLGFFTTSKIRGRGAWYDEGRVVIHLGDQVLVNGISHKPDRVDSEFIYEAGLKMRADIEHPLSSKEAVRFAQLCEVLPWDKPIYARYLAGWCVLAHIGGALTWRPHAWIVGGKGSGKTHTMSCIVRPILGDNCLFVQSESTGAGIRQNLAHDALPVLFDEAEGEDQFAVQRMQTILALVRQSSSDTGGVIAKGTPTGKAQSFNVRSCFAFSSINATIIQQSDKSRLTLLELSSDNFKIPLADLVKMEAEILTPNYINASMRVRYRLPTSYAIMPSPLRVRWRWKWVISVPGIR